ncbi:hypothetical protein TWF694_006434 [Orbilia ellipsospora]|uniref:Uncharacterized protein n=1 Tax=Orbilia ellipsospora TaxID=2528407 RepID=A0AAV9XLQ8_9PEZI
MKFTLVLLTAIVGLVAASPIASPVPLYDAEPEEFAKIEKRQCGFCTNHITCCAFPGSLGYCYKC